MKIDTLRITRILRRAMLPLAIVLFVLLWWSFGTVTIPPGMDTVPSAPPGSLIVIAKRPGALQPGNLILVRVGGGSLLTRVDRVVGDRLWVRHDNPDSRFPDGDELGPLPRDAVQGLVLTVLGGTEGADGGGDGR